MSIRALTNWHDLMAEWVPNTHQTQDELDQCAVRMNKAGRALAEAQDEYNRAKDGFDAARRTHLHAVLALNEMARERAAQEQSA